MNQVGRKGRTVADVLDARSLESLIAGDIAAIWHRGFLLDACRREAVRHILAAAPIHGFNDETSVLTIGIPLGLLISGALRPAEYTRRLDEFLQWAESGNAIARTPIDRLVDAVHGHGDFTITAASYEGLRLAPFVFRSYRDAARLRPHIDRRVEAPIRHLCEAARLAVNIYLLLPEPFSGFLELWDAVMSSALFDRIESMPEERQREHLGPAHIHIRPNPGDCVLFDAERIHAVSAVESGHRLTCSTFLGVGADTKSLALLT